MTSRFTSFGMFISNERVPATRWASLRPRFFVTMAAAMVDARSSTTMTTSAGQWSSSASNSAITRDVISLRLLLSTPRNTCGRGICKSSKSDGSSVGSSSRPA